MLVTKAEVEKVKDAQIAKLYEQINQPRDQEDRDKMVTELETLSNRVMNAEQENKRLKDELAQSAND